MNHTDISIIIVSWKVKELLKKCLDSIYLNQGDLSLEIFIVDNASADGTVEMIKAEYPNIRLIASDKNLGFAKANNLALQQARGEFILLLNPDTEINADTLANSLRFMKERPKCGVLGPKMHNLDGSPQSSVRRFPSVWPIFLMFIKLPKIFPHLKVIDNYLAIDFDYSKAQKVEQIMGAYMFMPRKVIDQVGLLDDRFFIWFEEVDFCRRLIKSGHEVWYSPSIEIMHHGGKSFSQQALVTNQKAFFMSALKYFIKYGFTRI